MTISLTLHPQEEARLIAAAQARGISPDALVREALDGLLNKILAEIPDSPAPKQPTRSLRGILAPYGPAPSAEEIDQNRAEMFAPAAWSGAASWRAWNATLNNRIDPAITPRTRNRFDGRGIPPAP